MTENDCRLIFNCLPGLYLILKPDAPRFTITYLNEAFAKAAMTGKHIIGKGLFEVFTGNEGNPDAESVHDLRASLFKVMETKKPHQMSVLRYDPKNPETNNYEVRYWMPVNTPVMNQEQEITYIIHSAEDVTAEILMKEQEKKAQQEARRLQDEQAQILESIVDGFISTDRNWKVKYWNRQAENIFNISRKDVLGHNLWDVIKEIHVKKLYAFFHEAMEENKPVHFEKYYALQDTWLQINAYPSEQGLTAFLVNITESKKAQELVLKNERRFRALIENISDGLIIISKTGVVLDVSYSGRKILGYRSQDLIGEKKYKNLIYPDDQKRVRKAFQYTLNLSHQRQAFISKLGSSSLQNIFQNAANEKTVEFRFKMPDGNYKWLEGTFHYLLDEDGIGSIVLNFRDITKRREQEVQLQTSEEKYRSLFNNSPATIIIWTLGDLRIQEVNQTAINLYGYTRNEFLSMNILDTRPIEEHERLINVAVELEKKGATSTGVWQIKTKRGTIIFMNISFHRINYGSSDAVLSLGTNVTDKIMLQKKLDQERRQKQQEITEAVLITQENERAELAKELHDNINNILNTTRLYIEHALTKEKKQEELLQHSHEYITKAIHEIRQLSRTLMPPSLGEVSLKQELEELFSNLKSLKTYDFEFQFSLDREDILSDALRLAIFRIIQEQLNNILKHAGATKIAVHIVQLDHKVKVYIRDNGKGFDPGKGPRGLGLRNITSRANLFGGQVEINSQAGQGTELQVIFPLPG
jgi:PAS domain S-box-containing protein